MPSGDRTGPDGLGPQTGRALGYCSGYDSPGFTRGMPLGRGYGRGWGRGFGRGRGFRRRAYYPEPYYEPAPYYRRQEIKPEEEKTYLENILKNLEEEIKTVKQKIQELSKKE